MRRQSAGVTAIKQLGTQFRFNVDVTDDARKFDEAHLELYRGGHLPEHLG
jgi:cytochrome c